MHKPSGTAAARLRSDYLRLKRDPIPYISAEPLPSNILEWHYVVKGPEDSPYHTGFYHGKLVFPVEYPFKPPSIYMTTPSGRFKTNTRLCLSISDFHPDTWNPAWSVSTILTGLLSFMLEKSPTFGSIETSDYEKKRCAQNSLAYNIRNKIFCELFPIITQEIKRTIEKRERKLERAKSSRSVSPSGSLSNESTRKDPSQVSALGNILVLIGFAIFACIVKYVISTIGEESG